MSILRARLLERKQREEQEKYSAQRRGQIGQIPVQRETGQRGVMQVVVERSIQSQPDGVVWFGSRTSGVSRYDPAAANGSQFRNFTIADGQEITVGDVTLRAIHTPGHTPGSLCFYAGSTLFDGDTLFPGGPGATRGNKEHFAQIIAAIRDKLFVLPDDTAVRPGHGTDTTIGAEKPHLQEWIDRGW